MTNTALFAHMIDRYNTIAYTHHYIWGFFYKKNVYMVTSDESVMPYICTLDKASRGQGYSLRFCPTVEQKIYLLPKATLLCSKKFFEETVKESVYNKGEIFEKMVTEQNGLTWEKDHIPFTDGPDAVINNIPYQIKFERATFTNEKFLANH